MTIPQMLLMIGLYTVVLGILIYVTRAGVRRIVGALAGGAAAGLIALGGIALGRELGWWTVPFTSSPYFVFILYAGFAITCSPIYIVTWRVARRFGSRGLAVFVVAVAIIGPPRDYLYAFEFPEWMVFSPGLTPILADCLIYIGIVVLGHAVMRLVAGPAGADTLTQRQRA